MDGRKEHKMMFKRNVAVAIKVGGKVLRESSDRVILPFGSEYSVLLKNLDSVRVQAKVSVDGQDATEGTWLVIEPNSSIELERFIRNGNLDKGNKFKFIERTTEIEDARGIKVDDGLVRVEYKKEYVAPQPITQTVHTQYIYDYDWNYWPYTRPYNPWRYPYYGETWCQSVNRTSGTLQQAQCYNSGGGAQNGASFSASTTPTGSLGKPVHAMNFTRSAEPNDAGITVPGSESNQKFQSVSSFQTESQSEVIILHLVGRKGSLVVQKPLTVDTKPVCVTCHKMNKGNAKFCSRCGTALEII